MKPRYEEVSYETTLMLEKAKIMNDRLDSLEKAKCDCGKEPCECKDCPKCGSKMEKGSCMKMGCGGKMAKAEDCPKCGSKMEKGSCMKMGCGGKMAKAEPGFKAEKITDINPHFVAESGGQTRNAYYTTNGRTIETEDVKPKKKGDKAYNTEKLSQRMNPHEGGGVEREESFDKSGY
jgi:hypothetical protein